LQIPLSLRGSSESTYLKPAERLKMLLTSINELSSQGIEEKDIQEMHANLSESKWVIDIVNKEVPGLISKVLSKDSNTHLGKLENNDIFIISKNFKVIENKLQNEIKQLNGPDKISAQSRLNELTEMVKYAEVLKEDKFKPDIINELVNCRLEIKQLDIKFPGKLGGQDDETEKKTGKLKNENGVEFGNLREGYPADGNSVMEKLYKLCDSSGGSSAFLSSWHEDQAYDSQSKLSSYVKENILSFRDVSKENFWIHQLIKMLNLKKTIDIL
jgi:hypothetical protein